MKSYEQCDSYEAALRKANRNIRLKNKQRAGKLKLLGWLCIASPAIISTIAGFPTLLILYVFGSIVVTIIGNGLIEKGERIEK